MTAATVSNGKADEMKDNEKVKAIDKKSVTGQILRRLTSNMTRGDSTRKFVLGVILRILALSALVTLPYITGQADPDEVKGRIVFENVSFAYRRPDGELDPPALKNINLTIEPGQQVGFLGATGAGKSALVNLIPRFYDVTGGRITIDGVDIQDIPQDNLQKIVGIALQEAVLFKGDLRFNLKFAQPEVEDLTMFNAAKAADSWGFINGLPEKWEAPVVRRGYNFSGGQRQRLSINRALTQQPKILILDDSTSALDASTEGRVQGAIPEFTHGVTTLYVAQRIGGDEEKR